MTRVSADLTVQPNTGRSIADLGCVEQTLLIPLAARALARRFLPHRGFADPAAEAIVARLAYETRGWAGRADNADTRQSSSDQGELHEQAVRRPLQARL